MNALGIPSAVTPAETAQLEELARGGLVLELGAHFGYSTIALAQAARKVHSVDWHQGDSMAGHMNSLEAYFTNLRRHSVANVVTHVGRFEDVLPLLQPHSFDGCFLDGEHDRASVERDTMLAMTLVRHGGWFAWHDYGRFEVAEVVDALLGVLRPKLQRVDFLAWLRI
jgi:predicted O-methyltransferase YrrM